MVESSKRLVKVAKTAMILNGDGHAGMTQGDSLDSYTKFNETILAQCNRGTPSVILTNPPFAGVGDGRITDRTILEKYDVSKKWELIDGVLVPTADYMTDGVPPEMLFLERCIDWLAPGGRLGIVLPKGFLDTSTYFPARAYLFQTCKLLAVVNLHKNTFQPYTGVRTCLLVVQKKAVHEDAEYPIFMAISRKIGQDSEGKPIYVINDAGETTPIIDHDLDEIYAHYCEAINGKLAPSNYCFSINRSSIDCTLNINPQLYMPSLNETIKQVSQIGELEGWSVEALGQLAPNIKIFKGPRLKSENLIVESNEGTLTEGYYTPSAVLQEKSESIKYLDLSKASPAQLKTIEKIRVHRGNIVVTRSGSVGRVAYITQQHDKAIVSDDLIRIVIPDEALRHYIYMYLQSQQAQDQFKRNEYGSIQQHLEPIHVSGVLVPIPNDRTVIENIVNESINAVEAKEASQLTHIKALESMVAMIEKLIPR